MPKISLKLSLWLENQDTLNVIKIDADGDADSICWTRVIKLFYF